MAKPLNLNISVRKPGQKPVVKKTQKKYTRDPKALSAFIVIRYVFISVHFLFLNDLFQQCPLWVFRRGLLQILFSIWRC